MDTRAKIEPNPLESRNLEAHTELSELVLAAWDAYMIEFGGNEFDTVALPSPLKTDLEKLKRDLEESTPIPKGQFIRDKGRQTLERIIHETQSLTEEIEALCPDFSAVSLSKKEWHDCLGKVIDRIEHETTYFQDAIASGALNLSYHGLLSKQFKSAIVPITNRYVEQFMKQPIFFPEIGIILFPGKPPTAKELVTSMAATGEMPASFLRLQECVADILSWPLPKRLGSFLINVAAGMVTMPLQLVVRTALTIPRILGLGFLKRTHLPLAVDETLDAAFTAMSTEMNGRPHLDEHHSRKRYDEAVLERCPRAPESKRRTAVRSLMLLRALGFPTHKIGELINGAHYDRKKDRFTKLERIINKECKKLRVRTADDREHLLDLDDSVWRLTSSYSRLQAIRIAREEIIKAAEKPSDLH